MSETEYNPRKWFAERTDKELDECIQWMSSRHKVKDLERQLAEARKALQSIKDIAIMSIADHDTRRMYNIADEQLKEQG